MRVLVGLGVASMMLAGGCRQSDETVKAELRTQIVERCAVTNAPRAAEDPGFDTRKFCTCVSDQMIGDRSVSELRKLLETKEVAAEQGRKIGEDCFKQQSSSTMTAAAVEPGNVAEPATPGGGQYGCGEGAGAGRHQGSGQSSGRGSDQGAERDCRRGRRGAGRHDRRGRRGG
jgi:hypothetical protein